MKCSIYLAFFSLAFTACSSTPQLVLIAPGDTVAIVLASERIDPASADVLNKAIEQDARTGFISGAAVGAAWGLTCGPFLWICSPIGAIAGAAVGGTSGLIVGAVESLPRDSRAQLESAMQSYLNSINAEAVLREQLVTRTSGNWQIVPAPHAIELELQLNSISLNAFREERLVLTITATVTIRQFGGSGLTKEKKHTFRHESSPTYAQSWMENQDNFISKQFTDACLSIAEEIRLATSRKVSTS